MGSKMLRFRAWLQDLFGQADSKEQPDDPLRILRSYQQPQRGSPPRYLLPKAAGANDPSVAAEINRPAGW